jgi:hypothetical protein
MRASRCLSLFMLVGTSILIMMLLSVFPLAKATTDADATVGQSVYAPPGEVLIADNHLKLHDALGWDNIVRASQFINGYVVQPGQVFSFNQVVGERTVARGFGEGKEFAWNGSQYIVADAIGGGVCRIATAVFRASYDAGIAPLERHTHSIRVNYAAPGWDASVYWGVWDFKFRNPYPHPLKLTVTLSYRDINVKIYELPGASQ